MIRLEFTHFLLNHNTAEIQKLMEERNPRPKENNSNIPNITLGVLFFLIAVMLYVAGEYFNDKNTTHNEITNGSSKTDETPLKAAEDTQTDEKTTDKTAEDKKIAGKDKAKEEPKKTEEVKKEEAKKPEVKMPEGGESMSYTVKEGETFSSIASKYGLDPEALKKLNEGVTSANFKAGSTKLKVKVRAIHIVGAGDVLRVVATKYGISKAALMKANGKTKDFAERGEKLIIPFK